MVNSADFISPSLCVMINGWPVDSVRISKRCFLPSARAVPSRWWIIKNLQNTHPDAVDRMSNWVVSSQWRRGESLRILKAPFWMAFPQRKLLSAWQIDHFVENRIDIWNLTSRQTILKFNWKLVRDSSIIGSMLSNRPTPEAQATVSSRIPSNPHRIYQNWLFMG